MAKGELRIGLISDTHYGIDYGYQAGSHCSRLLRCFLDAMDIFQPDLVVHLGDTFNNVSLSADHACIQVVAEQLQELDCPVRFVAGNHDLYYLSREQFARATRQTGCQVIENVNGWPVLFLDTEEEEFTQVEKVQASIRALGRVNQCDVKPGEGNSEQGLAPMLVFSHRPLQKIPLTDNKLFPPNEEQYVPWGRELIQCLLANGLQPVCINGHLHWNHFAVFSSCVQIAVPSLVDTWELGEPAASFGELTVNHDGLELNVRGKMPAHYWLPWLR